ncbi:RnfABCDGE type electron transport complex subunit D [Paenibacillus sp. RC67]|uniref:RnfABCDGE type electron transport complex subunit D n=1 Tax=Paenibacillus sp. RC67 TaxID=3039392 RepID=UPI0024ACA48C|nr:RnfABCDGE type electron transport complex subunit D [Paenibacillus sp. RC67]
MDQSTTTEHRPYRKKQPLWRTPKGYVMLLLLILLAVATLSSGIGGLTHTGVAVLAAVVTDLCAVLLQKRKPSLPDGAIVTGLIVALVLSYKELWYIAAAASSLSIISKHVLRMKRKPLFNPAALGLLLSSVLFFSGQDWWGSLVELPVWSLAIVIIIGFMIVDKVNKFPQVLVFLGTYFALLLILSLLHLGEVMELYQPPFLNAILFLSFVMVTDPPTSPGNYSGQVGFGLIAAVGSIAWNVCVGGTSFLLIGLLCANVIFRLTHWSKSKRAGITQSRQEVRTEV